jgi:vesicle coat complex subunit
LLGFCLALAGCGRDPVADLAARLQDPNVEVRRAAVEALGQQPVSDVRVIDSLTRCIGDNDGEVRYGSIAAVGRIGPPAKSSLPALKSALQDVEPTIRQRAALSIARIDPLEPSFIPVLVGAMRDGDGRVLLEIASMGAEAAWAVPTLTGLLSHQSPKVRALAASALGGIGSPAASAKPALQQASRDSNAIVKTAAREALQKIDPMTSERDG